MSSTGVERIIHAARRPDELPDGSFTSIFKRFNTTLSPACHSSARKVSRVVQAEGYRVYPIGKVHQDKDACWIEVFEPYRDGLHGIGQFSHVTVLFWCHKKSSPEERSTLGVFPCGNEANPQTGVFATRSPSRPNPIAVSVCRLLEVGPAWISLVSIDADDQSPVLDIKGYFPEPLQAEDIVIPDWQYRGPDS